MRSWLVVPALALAVIAGACADKKTPAEAAVNAAQSSYSAISADAEKLVPAQARPVADALAAARADLAKSDYDAAIAKATALPAQISTLAMAVASKKAEASGAWAQTSAAMVGMVTALQTQVATMVATKKMPAGVTKANVDAAQASLATISDDWARVTNAATAGDFAAANAQAAAVRTKVMAVMASLKMTPPA